MFKNWIEANRDEIIAKTQDILRIESVGTEATAPDRPFGDKCAEALDWVLDLGREMGFAVKNVDGYAGHIEFGEGDDYLAVLGHLDVVPAGAGWTHAPFGAGIHEGKIVARGAIDDKGPMMAALFALQAIKESGQPLKTKVRLIFGLDEESQWRCVDHYFKQEPKPIGGFTPDADFPLIYAEKGFLCANLIQTRGAHRGAPVSVKELKGGERPNMVADLAETRLFVTSDVDAVIASIKATATAHDIRVNVEHNGQELLLTVHGTSAHGATPFLGVNAVIQTAKLLAPLDTHEQELWQLVAEIDAYGQRLGIQMDCHATGALTTNLGLASVTDELATFNINVRYPVDQTFDSIMEQLAKHLEPAGWSVADSGHNNMAPHYVPRDSKIVETLLRVYRDATGDQREPLTTGGATYARSIPNAVAFGAMFPGEEALYHQPDESWSVENLLRCTEMFAQAIYELAK